MRRTTCHWVSYLALGALLCPLGCDVAVSYLGARRAVTTGTGGHDGGAGTGGTGGASLCVPGATQPCYDGPAGTEGQGICRAGTQTCAADGTSFGACLGEVLPKAEDCATPEDEDCDGKAPACKGALLWAKRFGDAGDDLPFAIATDAAGNVVVTGRFSGTVDFGGGVLTSAGGQDIFVLKLDPSGKHVWSRRFGDADDQLGTSVAVDTLGNVLVAGYFSGQVDFGDGALVASDKDTFVAKLDADGGPVWSKRLGGAFGSVPVGVAVDADRDVLVTGAFADTVDFGGGALTSAGGPDIFLVKLTPDGGHLWSRRFGDPDEQYVSGVAVDGDGSVVLTGNFTGVVDFGGGALASVGLGDSFIAKLDKTGAHVWSKRFGTAGSSLASVVTVSADGSVFLTGGFTGTVTLGGDVLPSAGGRDIFIAMLAATNGAWIWAKRFGNGSDQSGASVATDKGGNVLVAGYMNGTVDFGGGPLPSEGGSDVFVVKLDAMGGHVWSKRFGGSWAQAGTGITADGADNVLVTGYMNGAVDFGGGPLTSAGQADIFVAKLGP